MAVHRDVKHRREPKPDAIEALEADTDKILRRLRKYITANYGERCPDFDKDCPCCRVWVRYDLLEEELG